jgi:hypothetical protein
MMSRAITRIEAKARYGLLLLKQAREMFMEVVRASSARPVAIAPGDKEWIRIAKANLRYPTAAPTE